MGNVHPSPPDYCKRQSEEYEEQRVEHHMRQAANETAASLLVGQAPFTLRQKIAVEHGSQCLGLWVAPEHLLSILQDPGVCGEFVGQAPRFPEQHKPQVTISTSSSAGRRTRNVRRRRLFNVFGASIH